MPSGRPAGDNRDFDRVRVFRDAVRCLPGRGARRVSGATRAGRGPRCLKVIFVYVCALILDLSQLEISHPGHKLKTST